MNHRGLSILDKDSARTTLNIPVLRCGLKFAMAPRAFYGKFIIGVVKPPVSGWTKQGQFIREEHPIHVHLALRIEHSFFCPMLVLPGIKPKLVQPPKRSLPTSDRINYFASQPQPFRVDDFSTVGATYRARGEIEYKNEPRISGQLQVSYSVNGRSLS